MTERSISQGSRPEPMDADGYRRLLEAHLPGIEIRTCEPITDGWSSYVLEVNGRRIFRFPRRPEIAHGVETEILLLPLLAEALPVAVPSYDVIARDRPDDPALFVGYDKIQGQQLHRDSLPVQTQRRQLARDIGELLSALHSIPTDGLATANVAPVTADGWRRQYQAMFERAQQDVFPLLDVEAQRAESAFWHEFLDDDENFSFVPALVHADLGPEHIICDYGQSRVVGVIDWEDAQIGDPAMDVTGMLNEMGEAFAKDVLEHYAGNTDQRLPNRARYYARVVPYHHIWFGQETGAQVHVRQGLKRIGLHTVVD
ncbi:MAG: hypothetical protein FI707_05310 [SAR202 cluster bacterium]|nr:phosphotransferase [SAR202 cluster bacterium]MDP6663056.1 phosphotransferase [SAR202 cluster bacterium]MQG57427.1 hypothetical protein [SAR202 cluster bacterium]MQG68190.1 hypothetical protein [SAR202 cluster bacterium]HAL49693.1 hypothetical protein [Dehalococcoidia bacterium]